MIALTAILSFSCGNDEITREDLLPDASGEHGKILVVVDNAIWETSLQENLHEQLDQNCEGPYLRPEPLFSYFRTESSNGMTHIDKLSRLILKFKIDHDSTYQETAVIVKENFFARGQLFVVIKDSDFDRMNNYVKNDFDFVLDAFNDYEHDRLVAEFKGDKHNGIDELTKDHFGINISLPRTTVLKVDSEDFMMAKYERSEKQQYQTSSTSGYTYETFWIQEGILFWKQPLDSASYFEPYQIMAYRDSVLKEKVPGELKGSYMATEYDPYYKPEADIIEVDGQETIVIRGLWKFAGNPGAFGGGPFVQYSMINKKRNEIITVCGYVYAPKFNKREYIRQVEAMLSTIEMEE
jgi:hypothetical protein